MTLAELTTIMQFVDFAVMGAMAAHTMGRHDGPLGHAALMQQRLSEARARLLALATPPAEGPTP